MAGGQDGDERLRAHDLDLDLGRADRGPQEAEIEPAVDEPLDLRRGELLAVELEPHVGQLPAQLRDERGHDRERRRAGEAEGDAPDLPAGRAPRVVGGVVEGAEQARDALEQQRAGGGQLDAPRGAGEQRRADLGFEAADLLRQRRLPDVQPVGGAAEVLLLGDRHERLQQLRAHDVEDYAVS